MAFSTTALRYGWAALASLGVLTGTTIYIANNRRHQVKPQDIIELDIGTTERCMALQTADGTYPVARPSFVRTWTSNVYTTNGVTVYTNIVTNTIGWHVDRDMMASLDNTITNLIPYYSDPTTSAPLTVTGLFASLGIGDKTNKFTRTPCWTNPISTNWIVNYTSYWPSTNGTATNICYTSDYRQVVNYAQSWTATGGHVWVTSSNWASEVVTVTNAATYGAYPWQIYVEDLQERYKVLNALQWASNSYMWCSNRTIYVWFQPPSASVSPYWKGASSAANGGSGLGYRESWGYSKDRAELDWSYTTQGTNFIAPPIHYSAGGRNVVSGDPEWSAWLRSFNARYFIGPFDTGQVHTAVVQARSIKGFWNYSGGGGSFDIPIKTFSSVGAIGPEDEWVDIINITGNNLWEVSSFYGSLTLPLWCDEPTSGLDGTTSLGNNTETKFMAYYGITPPQWFLNGTGMTNTAFGLDYIFYYCTNKYW